MGKRNLTTSIFLLSAFIPAFGQWAFGENLVSDSTVLRHAIKKVVQIGYGDTHRDTPYWTTEEIFDDSGRIIQRTSINHSHHKFVQKVNYHKKNNSLKITTLYYDWSSSKNEPRNDTTCRKTRGRYKKVDNRIILKGLPYSQNPIRTTIDSMGRVIQSVDTIKCGKQITDYTFDITGNVVEKRYHITRHNDEPRIVAIDSLKYNELGQLIEEVNYSGFKKQNPTSTHNREVNTTFTYNEMGLLAEKVVITKYLTLENTDPNPLVYQYEYDLY